jgi:hypothetical protein
MKPIIRWILLLALSLPPLAACGQPEPVPPDAFDVLARWVPVGEEQAFFLDFKPEGQSGRHWQRIRDRIDANLEGQEALATILGEFGIEEYGLQDAIDGPAVSVYSDSTHHTIAQVSDGAAAREALYQHFEGADWEQVEFEGATLYQARILDHGGLISWLAWTVHDGLLFLLQSYGRYRQVMPRLQELLSLPEGESLAALPAWGTLRGRLPQSPMGLIFLKVGEPAFSDPPTTSAIVGQQMEALAAAAVPEADGMRVEVAGTLQAGGDVPPELQALYDLPAVDPAGWPGLPANSALALVAHDASLVWSWFVDIVAIDPQGLDDLRETIGLDLQTDLFGPAGPLGSDFALSITPPLPGQPIVEGLAAAQLLFLTRDATPTQADDVRGAMEGRGATFASGEVEGIDIQSQVGTALSGYALSYGLDDGVLHLASSPEIIGQVVVARREGTGLVETEAFQTVLEALPDESVLVACFQMQLLLDLVRANSAADEYQVQGEILALEAFEAIGAGLRFQPGYLDGVLYFLLP